MVVLGSACTMTLPEQGYRPKVLGKGYFAVALEEVCSTPSTPPVCNSRTKGNAYNACAALGLT